MSKKYKIPFFSSSFLVNNQKDIENQLGIRITDSGIGNPRRVRPTRKKNICKYKTVD
jgi:hypothetical protein